MFNRSLRQIVTIPLFGRSQINLSSPITNQHPFLNYLLATTAQNPSTTGNFPNVMDENNYFTSAPPANYQSAHGLPNTGSVYTGRWVIKWDGSGTAFRRFLTACTVHDGEEFVSGNPASGLVLTGGPGRVEFSFDSAITSVTSNWLASGTPGTVSNVRLCRLDQEALLDAGEYWNPDFLAYIDTLKPRILRLMDWNIANNNNVTKWGYRTPLTQSCYAMLRWQKSAWVGTISGTDTYTCAGATDTPGTWTHLEMFQGYVSNVNSSTTATIDVAGRGAKTIIEANGSALEAGDIAAASVGTFVYDELLDKVIYWSGGMKTGIPFELQIDLCNKTNSWFWDNIPYNYDDASVEARATYARDHLNPNLNYCPAFGNEYWNTVAGFEHSGLIQTRSLAAVPGLTSANNRQKHMWMALRGSQVMDIIGDVFGSRTNLYRVCEYHAYASLNFEISPYLYNNGDVPEEYAPYHAAGTKKFGDLTEVISTASYHQGTELESDDSNYTISPDNFANLRSHAAGYASGESSAMTAALDWVDSDLRDTPGTGGENTTLFYLANTIYPTWANTANVRGKHYWEYEGSLEIAGPSASRCNVLNIPVSHSANITNLITAYVNDDRMRILYLYRYSQFLGAMANTATTKTAIPSQYQMIANGGPWAPKIGDLYTTADKREAAIIEFNHS